MFPTWVPSIWDIGRFLGIACSPSGSLVLVDLVAEGLCSPSKFLAPGNTRYTAKGAAFPTWIPASEGL